MTTAKEMVGGLGWVAASSYINRAFGFVTTLVLAKLLSPDEFGLVAMGGMMTEALKVFRDLGLSQALIFRKDRMQEAGDTAMLMIVAMNCCLFAIAFIAAPFVAAFFKEPSATPILIVMSANLIPIGIRAVPEALIKKEMNFRALMLPDIVSVVIASVASIVTAYLGFGAWSLVIRTLMATVLGAALIWFFTPYRPRLRFNSEVARELFSYGKFVLGAALVSVVLYNLDKAMIARFSDVTALGIYTMAGAVAAIPVSEFGHILCRVAYPAFCRVNDRPERLQAIFAAAFRYNAMVVVPLGIGLVFFGVRLAEAFLGEKWSGVGAALQILAIASVARALSSLTHELLRSTGQVRTVQSFMIVRLLATAALGVPALVTFGLHGFCWLIAVTNILVLMIELAYVSRASGIRTRVLVPQILVPLAIAVTTIGGVFAVFQFIFEGEGNLQLAAAVVVAGAAYVGAVLVLNRDIVSEARALFGAAR
jgi:PST family polysaccharide transporter